MPKRTALWRIVVALVLALGLGACGDSGDDGSEPPSEPAGDTTILPVQTESCEAPEGGYRLEYPTGWFTNDAGIAEPCRFFHPEPFTLRPHTEATGIAISVRLNPVAFDEVVPRREAPMGNEVLERRSTTVDGRQAVRTEMRVKAGGLLPDGTDVVSWFVDAGQGTLVATTSEAAAAGRYEDNVQVLDGMMKSLRLSDLKPDCSADRSPGPVSQSDLPEAVSTMRMAIIDAARACDYEKLAALALAGDSSFTYSFGGDGSPAAFWRQAEAAGQAPLRTLVELLDGPPATRDTAGTTQYLWPVAYAFERWDDVPPSARQELRRIYGDDDLRRFQQFGSYVGHRVGITESGDWIFFVGGD